MKLERPVQLNSHVSPICLPNADLVNNLQDLNCVRWKSKWIDFMVNTNCDHSNSSKFSLFQSRCSTGWGKTEQSGKKNPEVLQKINTQIFDNSVCQKAYFSRFRIFIKESHLCAGSIEGGRGTCHVSSLFLFRCSNDNELIQSNYFVHPPGW